MENGGMKPWRISRKDVLGIKFACPDCKQHVDAGRELFGEMVECPTCGKLMQVPDLKNAPGNFDVRRVPRRAMSPPPVDPLVAPPETPEAADAGESDEPDEDEDLPTFPWT